jgi:hypothetical protein
MERREFVRILGLGGLGLVSFDYSSNNLNEIYWQFPKENKTEDTEDSFEEVINSEDMNKFVENARSYLEAPWIWGGRLTKGNPGLDCLGLLFLSYSKTFQTNWRDFSVYPSEIVRKEQLGKPVKGLDGILTKEVNIKNLQKGDIVYLLTNNPIQDKPLANINEKDYWPWHTGIYSDRDKNLFLEASPSKSKVVERSFSEVLEENEAI